MSRRQATLTGATGFLGWHVAEMLRDRGWAVRAVVRPGSAKLLPEGVEPFPSAFDAAALATAVAGSEVVIHAAAVTRARTEAEFTAVNVDGTRAVVEAANAAGARVVFISSLAAIGSGTPARPAREDADPRPINAYGRSKLAAEAVVRATASLPWTILRPSAVYGPRDRQFLPLFRLASRGLFLLAAPASTPFTMVYADDVVRAIVMAAETPRAAGQPIFIGHGEPATTADILSNLARTYGRRYAPRRIPRAIIGAAALAGDVAWRLGLQPALDRRRLGEFNAEGFVCAVDRAIDVLGFTAAVPLAEGIERTGRWYRDRGWV